MKLEWKSNAQYNEEVEQGSVFELKDNKLGISIHHYIGCGNNWYLTCKALKMSARSLETEDFEEAVEKAKKIICHEVDLLVCCMENFKIGDENILVRY